MKFKIIGLAVAAIVVAPDAASAQNYDPSTGSCYRNQAYRDTWTGSIVWKREWTPCAQRRRDYYEPRVYGYERREYGEERDRDGPRCLRDHRTGAPVRMSATGVEAYDLPKAKEAADSALQELIRSKPGARWMDLDNAEFKAYECWKSATGNRASEKVADFGGKTLHQCMVEAVPCRAEKQVVEAEPPTREEIRALEREGYRAKEDRPPAERRARLIRRWFQRHERR